MNTDTMSVKIASRLLGTGWQSILLLLLIMSISFAAEKADTKNHTVSAQDKTLVNKVVFDCVNLTTHQVASHVHCKGLLSNGYVAHYFGHSDSEIVAGKLHAERVVILDPGGPVLEEADAIHALKSVSATLDSKTVALSLVPPKPQPLSIQCRQSTPESLGLNCNISAISAMLVQGYSVALDNALEAMSMSNARLDLLAASYGSSRWSQLVESGLAPAIETAVVVSPLPVGISGQDLEKAQLDFARWIFDRILDTHCLNMDCMSEMELNPSHHCSGEPCAPEQRLKPIVRTLSDSEILEGLVGLAPFAQENGLTLNILLQEQDNKRLDEMLQQGRRQYLGMDPLGDMSTNEVYFLAGVCPVISENDLGYRYRYCESVERTTLSKPEKRVYDRLSGEGSPEKTCVAVTFPDPLLGTVGMQGPTMGMHAERSIVTGDIKHGDLNYGAQLLESIVSTRKLNCFQ